MSNTGICTTLFKGLLEMDINESKNMFARGVFSGVTIAYNNMEDCWLLLLNDNEGRTDTLETTRGEPRQFRDVATAIKAANDIGFGKFWVINDTTKGGH